MVDWQCCWIAKVSVLSGLQSGVYTLSSCTEANIPAHRAERPVRMPIDLPTGDLEDSPALRPMHFNTKTGDSIRRHLTDSVGKLSRVRCKAGTCVSNEIPCNYMQPEAPSKSPAAERQTTHHVSGSLKSSARSSEQPGYKPDACDLDNLQSI